MSVLKVANLNLNNIKQASHCFKYFRFRQKTPFINKITSAKIAEKVMIKSYTRMLETEFKPDWRTIVGWVDKLVFKNVDLDDSESFKAGKKQSEYVLFFLRNWYYKILLPEQIIAYSNIQFNAETNDCNIQEIIPILKIGETPVIMDVSDIAQKSWQMYNDIEIRGRAMLVSQALEVNEVVYHRLFIGKRGGFEEEVITLDNESHTRSAKMISEVVGFLQENASFPSVGDHCSTCEFKRRCII